MKNEQSKEEKEMEKINKDTYILEIIAKAREWQKTKSITTSSEVCKMLNALADKYLENEELCKSMEIKNGRD